MKNNQEKKLYLETNECIARGKCSISPALQALEELAITFAQKISYYLLTLEEKGTFNHNLKIEFITALASLVSINEYTDTQLLNIITQEYFILEEILKVCKTQKVETTIHYELANFSDSTSMAKAINLGEKLYYEKYYKMPVTEKNSIVLLQILIKTVSLSLIKLHDFNTTNPEAENQLLDSLNFLNKKQFKISDIKNKISVLAETNKKLQLKISEVLIETYGEISKTKVSHSTEAGKAILVSGNNFFDLERILQETQDKDIDIYTYSNLLITHALAGFKKYKNLKGHFGYSTTNCILDFAIFPGAILLTKNSQSNTEYLYRGRLFTTDTIVPSGVIGIENNDFTPLINAALEAKGFSKGKTKEDSYLGFDIDEVKEKITEISSLFNSKEIKRLYIISIDAHSEAQYEYFNTLFQNLKPDEYVLSFSHYSKHENVYTVDIGNFIPLATTVLEDLFSKISIDSPNIVFFLTTCDLLTISNLITLKEYKAQTIFMEECYPSILNPSVTKTLEEKYDIHIMDSIKEDLKLIRKNKDTQ